MAIPVKRIALAALAAGAVAGGFVPLADGPKKAEAAYSFGFRSDGGPCAGATMTRSWACNGGGGGGYGFSNAGSCSTNTIGAALCRATGNPYVPRVNPYTGQVAPPQAVYVPGCGTIPLDLLGTAAGCLSNPLPGLAPPPQQYQPQPRQQAPQQSRPDVAYGGSAFSARPVSAWNFYNGGQF